MPGTFTATQFYESHDHALQAVAGFRDSAGNYFFLICALSGNDTLAHVRQYSPTLALLDEWTIQAANVDKIDDGHLEYLDNGDVLVTLVAHEAVSTQGRRDEGSFCLLAGIAAPRTGGNPNPNPNPN